MREFLHLIAPQKALRVIRDFPVLPAAEEIVTGDALGRVLARDVLSTESIPPFPRSLVDGFAVKASDTYGAKETNPVFLAITGEVRIGDGTDITIEPGQAVTVSTGSMVPHGAEAAVMQEYTHRTGNSLEVKRSVRKGENIIGRGEDIKEAAKVLHRGEKISLFSLGVLAALGVSRVSVFKRPDVAVISSGDEIVALDRQPRFGQIRDINRYTLSGLLAEEGADTVFLGITKDETEDICRLLVSARHSDMILISGGSSKGERDLVVAAVEQLGGRILFHGIKTRPGKPTIFGELWGKPLFGLPGHPVSCIMVALRFVTPLLRIMQGTPPGDPGLTVRGILTTNIPSTPGMEECVPVACTKGKTGLLQVVPLFTKSSAISPLARASGYVVVPEDREGLEKHEEVEVHAIG
jgi:molybdopterin molybdotransferase